MTPEGNEEDEDTSISRQHFERIPWCKTLISDPTFTTTRTAARKFKPSTEDSLFSETLKTATTIPACLTLYKKAPGGLASDAVSQSGGTGGDGTGTGTNGYIDEVKTLYQLEDGMNGHPHMCHGGIISTIIDDVMGELLTLNRISGALRQATVTASLNVRYLKPVRTPGVVVVTARLREVRERKFYIESDVGDGEGVVLAEAEGLWIGLGGSRKEKL